MDKYIIKVRSTQDKVNTLTEYVYGTNNDRTSDDIEDAKVFDNLSDAEQVASQLSEEEAKTHTSLGVWGISWTVCEIDEEEDEDGSIEREIFHEFDPIYNNY